MHPSKQSDSSRRELILRLSTPRSRCFARQCRKQQKSVSIPISRRTEGRPDQSSYPRETQNFLTLCASGQYDGCLFHRSVASLFLFSRPPIPSLTRDLARANYRNIKGFMIQTGDPTGTGKGGQSIWGRPFPDEVRGTLKVRCLSNFAAPSPQLTVCGTAAVKCGARSFW